MEIGVQKGGASVDRLQHDFKYLLHQYEHQGHNWIKIKTTTDKLQTKVSS